MTDNITQPGTGSEHQAFLVGPHLYFRAAEPDDAKTATIWRKSLYPAPQEVVEEELKERLSRGIEDEEMQKLLIACRRSDDLPVGSVDMSMGGWRYVKLSMVVDRLLSPERREEVAAEMLQLIVPWSISERNVMAVELHLPSGQPALEQKIVELGGQSVGRLREFQLVDGERRDEIWYQFLSPTWVGILGEPDFTREGDVERETRSPARRNPLPEIHPDDAWVIGDRLFLRPIRKEETKLVAEWARNETEIVFPEGRWVSSGTAVWSTLEKSAKKSPPGSTWFAIAFRETDELIGINGMFAFDWLNRTAETATEIFRTQHREKGLGTEAKHLLLEYAFDRLGLHAVSSYVSETNPRSAAALRKQGYREAGYVAWDAFAPGGLCGGWLFDLLAREWRSTRTD